MERQERNRGEEIRHAEFPHRITNQLSPEEIVPATQKLISGESFDFISEKADGRSWTKVGRKNGPFFPILLTILNSPEIESKKACAMLTDDLNRFSPDKSLLSSQNLLKEWFFKLTLGVFAHLSIAVKLSEDKDLRDSELGRYNKEVEKQIGIFGQTLASLRKDDLTHYIRFEDMFHFYGTHGLFHSSSRHRTIETSDPTLTSVANNEVVLKESFLEGNRIAWERLRVGWGAKEIQDVMSLLPNIRSSTVVGHVTYALEDNCFEFSEAPQQDRKEKLKIDPHGIIVLLKWKNEQIYSRADDHFAKMYPRVTLKLEENLESSNFSVPRKHLPRAAISLLAEAAKRSDKTEFTNLIESVQELAVGENVNVPWFITLLALRAQDPETSEVIEQAVSRLGSLPIDIRDVFLNRRPGKLWLRLNGQDSKLRFTDKRTMLLSAFPIYASSKENPEIIISEVSAFKKEEPKKPEAKTMIVSETSNVPFFGEIGIPKESADAKNIISCLFEKRQSSLDEEKLLDEFEKLSDRWRVVDPNINRNLSYIARLNASDHKLIEASEHGIEAVYIKGEEAVLIIRKDLAVASASDKTIPIGLNGKIDESGQLIIEGMDKSFVGEKEHLFLNNLVLYLLLQPLLYKSGIPEEEDKELIREINKAVSLWNRSPSRGLLPKIDRNADIRNIAVRIAGYSNPVLVGEKSD